QARRLDAPEGRQALEEAVRRVGSIALVHELLSTTPDESVPFDEVADRVLAMLADVSSRVGDEDLRPVRRGSFGSVPAEVATPLSVVLTELVQNAIEHGRGAGRLEVSAAREEGELRVEVADDGSGLPPGFDLAASDRLGLQIVRTLVEGELGGRLALERRAGGGTLARVV